MFPAAPPHFVTEPLPYFVKSALQAVDGSVIFRQVERGNVIEWITGSEWERRAARVKASLT